MLVPPHYAPPRHQSPPQPSSIVARTKHGHPQQQRRIAVRPFGQLDETCLDQVQHRQANCSHLSTTGTTSCQQIIHASSERIPS
jgi:hypothetical protein